MANQWKQSQRTKWGTWAEDEVSQLLTTEGWFITKTCKIDDGGAPKAIGAISAHVLPDIQRSRNGITRWGEIKFKDSPTYFRARKEWRHGVDLNNWNDYLRVEEETGIPGDLFIIEWRPNESSEPAPVLLLMSFRKARNVPVQEIPAGVQRFAPHGIIYWSRQSFEIIRQLDPGNAPWRETVKETLRKFRELEMKRAESEGLLLSKPRRRWDLLESR
jgi:hypothetical protein